MTHYFAEQGGGIERVAAQLARHLEAGGSVRITWAASDTCPRVDSLNCVTQCLPMKAWDGIQRATGAPWPIWSAASVARLWTLVGEASIVHLHDCLYMGNVFAFLFATLRGRPVVVTQHVSDVPFKSPVLRLALWIAYQSVGRLVLGKADQVVFISEEVREDFSRRFSFKQSPRFIPNGVDSTLFCPADEEEREALRAALFGAGRGQMVFLFVGRFVEKKGLSILRRLAGALPDALFVLLGQGPIDPRTWGLKNLCVPGAVSQRELSRYYQAADLLVLPSVGEGLPLVVQEAMSAGLSVAVSSRTARADPAATALLHHQPCTDELEEDEVVARWTALLRSQMDTRQEAGEKRHERRNLALCRWSWEACAARYKEIFDVFLS